MIIADYYELADVFYGDSFIDGASVFFKRLGLVESAEVKSYASEIKSWVYDLLGYDVHLSKEERSALGWIQSAAELASILMESGETIRLFSIQLKPSKDRSQIAYTIQKMFSKGVGDCSNILFCQDSPEKREIMLTMDTGNDIILSDWYSVESDADKFLNIATSSLSWKNARDFQADLSYVMGREYYFRPFSSLDFYVFLYYSPRAFLLEDGHCDWEALHKEMDALRDKAVLDYGDDYVEPCHGDGKGIDDLDIPIDDLYSEPTRASTEVVNQEDLPNDVTDDNFDRLITQLEDSINDPVKLMKILDFNQPKKESIDQARQKASLMAEKDSTVSLTVETETVPNITKPTAESHEKETQPYAENEKAPIPEATHHVEEQRETDVKMRKVEVKKKSISDISEKVNATLREITILKAKVEDREQKIALLDSEKQKVSRTGGFGLIRAWNRFTRGLRRRKMPLEVTKRDTRAIQKEMSMVIQEKEFLLWQLKQKEEEYELLKKKLHALQ